MSVNYIRLLDDKLSLDVCTVLRPLKLEPHYNFHTHKKKIISDKLFIYEVCQGKSSHSVFFNHFPATRDTSDATKRTLVVEDSGHEPGANPESDALLPLDHES